MRNFLFKAFLFTNLLLSGYVAWMLAKLFNSGWDVSFLSKHLFAGDFPGVAVFFISWILMFIIIGAIVVVVGQKLNMFKPKDNLASGEFAGMNEFKDFTGDDGLMIGKKFRLSAKKSFEHAVCVGPTGSGKSASFFIPNLLSLPDASIVVSDPKGELFQKTAATNLAQGKRILVFSPFKDNSMRYNPLALCKTVSEVRELGQMLLANGEAAMEAMSGKKGGGSSEWTNMAAPLLNCVLLYVRPLEAPENTVSYAVNLVVENDIETLKFLMMDAGDDEWGKAAQKQFNIFMQSAESEKTASSIKTVLATNLQMFLDPMIEEVTSRNEINPIMLRNKPTVLYVVVPEHKSDIMAPLMAPFYSQLMGKLLEHGDGCPVFFLLDEFSNIGLVSNIDKYLSVVRSRRISISIGIQSINQLKQRYGQEAAISIMDNLKTKFVLPGLAYDSAKYISDLIGFREVDTTSASFGKDTISHSTSKQKRELLTPDEIRRLPDLSTLIITDNRNPFMDQQPRYYMDPKMLKMTEQEMDIDQYVIQLRAALDKSKQQKKES